MIDPTVITDRVAYIRDELTEHLLEGGGIAISEHDPDTWQRLPEGAHVPHLHDLGFWPVQSYNDLDTPLVFAFSPDRIADTTAHLDDDDLDDYLVAVEYLVDAACGYMLIEPDPLTRVRMAEDRMYDEAPGSLALLNAVHVRVLETR